MILNKYHSQNLKVSNEWDGNIYLLYSDHNWLTNTEISLSIPSDLPIFLELNEWFHPDLADNQLPSETEAFIQIAEALATGSKALYKPTVTPNTHWKYWPEGGTL